MAGLRLVILGFAALFISAGSVAAQQYRTWDRNNDGIVTRAEWRGTPQQFRERDRNDDGMLSGNELDDQAWGRSSQDGTTFAALDRNGDRRLARGEWRGDRAGFLRADRNGDNFISRAEFLNSSASNVDTDITDFNALDVDGSGRVELDEWRGTRPAFNRMDVNRDGVISRREMMMNDAVTAGADEFAVMDYNNNGVISRGEWREGAANFSRYDANRDGAISRVEYERGARGTGVNESTVIVDARQPWTDSGTYVTAGDVVTLRADGTIQMTTGADDRATPAGSLTGRTASNAPRSDQRAGALLIRIGNGAVDVAGAGGTFTARNSGRIYLGVNDDHFPDNSGQYRVWLSVQQR